LRHELLTTLDFLKYLECAVSSTRDISPTVWLSGSDRSFLDGMRKRDRKIVGLFPSASFQGRCWDPKNYESLARMMHDRITYALFGSIEDAQFADKVASFLKKGRHDVEIINLTGKTNLRELYKTISDCDLFIGMETSGLHFAIMGRIPVIGIVGGGHYGRFVPWGDEPGRQIFLTHTMDCFTCNWDCRTHSYDCVQKVQPEEVADKANMLLHR
jgi:ADP-heptose:LPS heptosyltransferase